MIRQEIRAAKREANRKLRSPYRQQPIINMKPEEYEKEVTGTTANWKHHVNNLLHTITMPFTGKNRRSRRFSQKK